MSDIPRFACFSDGMREGYNESWVRSSDYDALRAERDALAKDNAALRALLAECRRHVVDNHEVAVNEDDRLAEGECNALLDRIDAAVQEVRK